MQAIRNSTIGSKVGRVSEAYPSVPHRNSCWDTPVGYPSLRHWSRLDRVWYANTRTDAAAIGFDDSAFYDEFTRPVDARLLPMSPLLRDEAQTAFVAWQKSNDMTPY